MKNIWILLALVACSVEKIGVRSTTTLLDKASDQVLRESNLQHFQDASLASIKLLEGFWYVDQSNKKLISLLIKTYAGYGYAIAETELYKKQILGIDTDLDKVDALESYSKALRYGEKYLAAIDQTQEGILFKSPDKLTNFLKNQTTEKDLVALFYLAQSFGSLINLNRTNMELVSFLPNVKAIFDFVCDKKPDIENGGCDLFYSVYEGSRPKILGGNPELGKKLFKKYSKKYPENLLAKVVYLQHMVIPALDEREFNKIALELNKEFEEFQKYKDRSKDILGKNKFEKKSEFNLFNAIALERFEIMKRNKKDIF